MPQRTPTLIDRAMLPVSESPELKMNVTTNAKATDRYRRCDEYECRKNVAENGEMRDETAQCEKQTHHGYRLVEPLLVFVFRYILIECLVKKELGNSHDWIEVKQQTH